MFDTITIPTILSTFTIPQFSTLLNLLIYISLTILLLLRLLHLLYNLSPTSKTILSTFYGSGGHTTELLLLLKVLNLDPPTTKTINYCGLDDPRSQKIISKSPNHYYLPRSRYVLQSWLTTPFTALWSLAYTFVLVIYEQIIEPSDIILSNGPGTGLIVLACFRVSNWVLGTGTRLVYVESWCRVRRLSLTGRLGARIVDRFGVCWSGVEGPGRELLDGVMFESDTKINNKTTPPKITHKKPRIAYSTLLLLGVWLALTF